jgi:glycosyltransferase involved in cell wall biosynthesis
MKVMLVIPHVSGGGGEKVLSDLACNLRAEIVVVVFEERFTYPIKGKLISLHAPIRRTSLFSRASGFVRRIFLFRRALRAEQPDAVLSFMGEANFINALVSRRPVLTVHTHLSSIAATRGRMEAVVVNFLTRRLYKKASVVAVSQGVKRDLVDNFGIPAGRVMVIPNAVDLASIADLSREEVLCPWNPDFPVIITTGRMTAVKAQWHLIRAFAQVRKTRACQLAILGAGELESYLKTLAAGLGIAADVYFLGWQANPFKFLARADVFVLPSMTESFGLALVEAMACGLAVIATDCPGGSREIVVGGEAGPCGVLVPVPDGTMYGAADPITEQERELALQIANMLADEKARERYIKAGAARAREFDRAGFLEKYERLLIQTCVGQHKETKAPRHKESRH